METDPMDQLLGHSITYRVVVGPQQGRKVFTLQTLPTWDDSFGNELGKVADFSLHAGVAAKAHERKKLERLCRYISRPAVSEKRLSLTPNGNVRYQLKTPYRKSLPRERSECFGHGTTHVIFEPLDFIHRRQPVCGRQAGRRRPTCLAESIRPFTSFQWQLSQGQPGHRLARCPE